MNGAIFLHQLAEEDTMLLGDQLGLMASVFAFVSLPCGVVLVHDSLDLLKCD